MSKTIISLLILCIIGGGAAIETNESIEAINPLLCLKLTAAMKNNIDALNAEYAILDIPNLVVTAYTILESAQALVNACQATPQDLHIPVFAFQNLYGCVVNTQDLLGSFQKLGADLQQKNVLNLFDDATAIVTALQNISFQCSTQPGKNIFPVNQNILGCLANSKGLYENITLLSQTTDLPNKIVVTYTILESLQELVNSCGLNLNLHIPQITFGNLYGCIVNTEGLISAVQSLRVDLQSKNVLNLFDDVYATVYSLQSISSQCSTNPGQNIFPVNKYILGCLSNSKGLYKNVTLLKQAVELPETVVLAYTIIESLQALVNSCGLNVNLHIPQIPFNNLYGCVANSQLLVSSVQAIPDDLQSKNVLNLLNDAYGTVLSLQNISYECSTQPGKNIFPFNKYIVGCLGNYKTLYQDIQLLKESSLLQNTVVLAYNIIELLQPLVDSCGLKVNLHIPQIAFQDLSGCVVSSEELVASVSAVEADLKSKNLPNLYNDAASAVQALTNISSECSTQAGQNIFPVSPNVLKCISGEQTLYNEVQQLKQQAPLQDTVVLAYTIVESLQSLVNTCGLKINLHIPQIAFQDLSGCVVSSEELVASVSAVEADLKSKNLPNLYNDAAFAVQALTNISSECSTQAGQNVFPISPNVLICISGQQTLYNEVQQLKQQAPLQDTVVLAYTIVESLQSLVNSCGLKINLHIPQISFQDLSGCVVSSQDLVNSVQAVEVDLKSKNLPSLYNDAESVVNNLQSISSECSTQAGQNIFPVSPNVLNCINGQQTLYNEVQQLKQQAPLQDTVVLAYTIVESLQSLVNTCGLKINLHIPQIAFQDLSGCVVSSEELVASVSAVEADLKSKNLPNLYNDAASAVNALSSISSECSTQAGQNIFPISPNVLNCINGQQTLYNEVQQLQKHSPLQDTVVLAYTIIESLQPLVNTCGLKINLHIPKITFQDLSECIVSQEELIASVSAVEADLKSKNLPNLYNDATSAVEALQNISAECSTQAGKDIFPVNPNILNCITGQETLYDEIQELEQPSSTKNKVVLAYTIIQSLQPLVNTCGLKINLHIPSIALTKLANCVVSSEELVASVSAIGVDLKNKNLPHFYSDAISAVNDLQNISSQCSIQSGSNIFPVNPNILSCITGQQTLYNEIQEIQQPSTLKNRVVLAYNIVQSLQPLVNTCGLKINLHIPSIALERIASCIVDSQGLIASLQEIGTDLQNLNILKFIDDISVASNTLQRIQEECKVQKKETMESESQPFLQKYLNKKLIE